MQRTLTSFVAGIFTAAFAAVVAGDHTPAIMLALGFIAAALAGLASLGSVQRLYGTAERLQQLAEWIEAKPQTRSRQRTKLGSNNTLVMPDPREAELVSALVNFGSKRPAAAAAARYALAESGPEANIPELVRIAMRAPRVAA